MAFVICTKSKQDIKDLLSKVANYEEKPAQQNHNGSKKRLKSALTNGRSITLPNNVSIVPQKELGPSVLQKGTSGQSSISKAQTTLAIKDNVTNIQLQGETAAK